MASKFQFPDDCEAKLYHDENEQRYSFEDVMKENKCRDLRVWWGRHGNAGMCKNFFGASRWCFRLREGMKITVLACSVFGDLEAVEREANKLAAEMANVDPKKCYLGKVVIEAAPHDQVLPIPGGDNPSFCAENPDGASNWQNARFSVEVTYTGCKYTYPKCSDLVTCLKHQAGQQGICQDSKGALTTKVCQCYGRNGCSWVQVQNNRRTQNWNQTQARGVTNPNLPRVGQIMDFDADRISDLALVSTNSNVVTAVTSDMGDTLKIPGSAFTAGDLPTGGDFDGDGVSDRAVYNTILGKWGVLRSSGRVEFIQLGVPGTGMPAPGDYDGDGRTDVGVFDSAKATWTLLLTSTDRVRQVTFGGKNLMDVPVPGDYDGDGKTDIAVYRVATGEWFGSLSTGRPFYAKFGLPRMQEIPAPADYDGDGVWDLGMYRVGSGQFRIKTATGVLTKRVPATTFQLPLSGASNYLLYKKAGL